MNTHKQPYVGPRTYNRDEGDIFFGRDRDVRQLTSLVISQPLVLFYAQSGAGKSSLINAQLIPRLEHQGFEVLLPVGRVGGDPPSNIAIENIFVFNLLRSLDQDIRNLQKFAKLRLADFLADLIVEGEKCHYQPLKTSEQGANVAAEEDVSFFAEPVPRALIIDQFEEILTSNVHAWEQRKGFFQQLREALDQDPYLSVVLSIREDYVAGLDPYAHLLPGSLRDRFYMQRMGYDAALDAVRLPVQSLRPFGAGVAESLVDNLRQVKVQNAEGEEEFVAGQFVEPVQLQVVCLQLWEALRKRPGEYVTELDLLDVAGGQGLVEFVNTALSSFYEQAITLVLKDPNLNVDERDLRQWFSTRLITESHTRGLVYRGETHAGGTPENGGLPNEAVELLQERYLIRAETRAGGTWYELVHDRFIGPILSANQAWQVKRMQSSSLTRAADSWKKSGQMESKLYTGTLLIRAKERAKTDPAGKDELVQQFLHASQERQKSLDLAEAKKEAHQANILRQLAVGLFVTVIIAVAFGIAAFIQAGNAKEEAIVAGHSAAAATSAVATAVIDRNIAVDAQATATVAMAIAIADRDNTRKALATAVMAKSTAVAAQSKAVVAQSTAVAAQVQAETARNETESLRLAALARDQIGTSSQEALLLGVEASNSQGALLLGVEASKFMMTQEARNALLLALDIKANYQPGEDPPESAAIRQSFMIHDSPITASAVSSDGNSLATASSSSVIIWTNLTSGVPVSRTFLLLDGPTVVQMAFNHTGSDLTLFYADGTLSVGSIDNGQREELALVGVNKIGISTLSADGSILAIANCAGVDSDKSCAQGQVTLWDLTARHPISESKVLREGAGEVTALSFDRDGHLLAVGSKNGDVSLWGLSVNGNDPWIDHYRIGTKPVTALAFDPTDTTLASATDEGKVTVWRIDRDRLISTYILDTLGETYVQHIVFNSTGTLLVTADTKGRIGLWDGATGQPIGREMAGHLSNDTNEPVNNAVFLPNSTLLVTTGYDQRAIVWQMDSATWPQLACELAGRNLDYNEWVQAFGDKFYTPTCRVYPVHPTVIQAKINKGRELTRRCSRVDSEEAMSVLGFADVLDVNRSLDPATIMVQVLKETARIYLRQEDDDAASDCLEEANRIVDTEGLNDDLRVDVTAVVNGGLEMAKLLDEVQELISNDEYDQALAQIDAALDYNNLMSQEVDSGLLDAYYQICIGGAESGPTRTSETACQRVVELAPRLTFGASVFGDVADGNVWTFVGKAGQPVRIALREDGSGIDTTVGLRQADGLLLAFDDNGGDGLNSLIVEVNLSETGIYIIKPGASSSSGGFVLSLDVPHLVPIEPGEIFGGNIEDGTIWQILVGTEQLVNIALKDDGSGIDPTLKILDVKGNRIAYDDDSGEGYDSLLSNLLLLVDTPYFIVPGSYSSAGSYLLSVEPAPTRTIEIGTNMYGEIADNTVWQFFGETGQIMRIHMTEDRSGIDTKLEVRDPAGNWLAEDDDSGEGLNSLLSSLILPVDGLYSVLPSAYADSGAYLLTISETFLPETDGERTQLLKPLLVGSKELVRQGNEDEALDRLERIAVLYPVLGLDPGEIVRDARAGWLVEQVETSLMNNPRTSVSAQLQEAVDLAASLDNVDLALRICRMGSNKSVAEMVGPACQQVKTSAPEIAPGDTVTGVIEAGYIDPWWLVDANGREIVIIMEAEGSALDTVLKLDAGEEMVQILYNDDYSGSNSQIERMRLPAEGPFLIEAGGYGSSSGAYRLRVIDMNSSEGATVQAEVLINEGIVLARQGDILGAVTKYQEALALDPALEIDPEVEVKRIYASALIEDGIVLAQQGDISGAVAKYKEAFTLDPELESSPGTARVWNQLCWYGALWKQAEQVLTACDQAVLLSDGEPNYRDSRGVARAITGDFKGAIEDFEAYVAANQGEPNGEQRQEWIDMLTAGENPFDNEALLEELRQ